MTASIYSPLFSLVGALSLAGGAVIYNSGVTEALVGLNSSARSTLLPVSTTGSNGIFVAANRMPVGSSLLVFGDGLIGAASVAPGTFTLSPHVTPSGGSKTDLGGFSQTPALGADGWCVIRLIYTQLPTGLRTAGEVYYFNNTLFYAISVNPGVTATPPTVIPSDPTVDRVFGCDGQWGTASASNYVRARAVSATLIQAG